MLWEARWDLLPASKMGAATPASVAIAIAVAPGRITTISVPHLPLHPVAETANIMTRARTGLLRLSRQRWLPEPLRPGVFARSQAAGRVRRASASSQRPSPQEALMGSSIVTRTSTQNGTLSSLCLPDWPRTASSTGHGLDRGLVLVLIQGPTVAVALRAAAPA